MIYYTYIYLNTLKPGYYQYDEFIFYYEPFYVGKGKGNRYLDHVNHVKNKRKYKKSLKYSIIEENLINGVDPIILKVKENISEDESLNLEKFLISKIGRLDLKMGTLTNLNDGGHKPQDNYRHSVETKRKISESGKKRNPDDRYDLISPTHKIYKSVNLADFCRNNNLNYNKMAKSSNCGKIKIRKTVRNNNETNNCEGWEVINNKNRKEKEKKVKYTLISPDNISYTIYSNESGLDFCEKLNLDFRLLTIYKNRGKIYIRNIDSCKKDKSKNCQGWEFINHINDNETDFSSKRKPYWKIVSPIGDTILIKNLREFCIDNGLSERTLRSFKDRGPVSMVIRKNYNEKILNTIGWSCYTL